MNNSTGFGDWIVPMILGITDLTPTPFLLRLPKDPLRRVRYTAVKKQTQQGEELLGT